MAERVRRAPRWHRLAFGPFGLLVILVSGTIYAETPAGGKPDADATPARRVYLDCVTETNKEYAGVEFKYVIDEATETVRVSRWGEPVDIRFGPSYITYRTRGMALKMAVSINRKTWQFTMLHEGGSFIVTGVCQERAG